MMLDCIVDKDQAYGAQRTPNGFHSLQQMRLPPSETLTRQRSLASYQCTTQSQPPSCAGGEGESTTGGGNDLIGYYFGSISRETAEWILKTHGNQQDGAYLLRSSGPSDNFVLSLLVNHATSTANGPATTTNKQPVIQQQPQPQPQLEVLHYKIVETDDSFVALHGQVGDEKFATIDELIDKARGVATKPRWPIIRHSLDSQILPPTFWGLTVDQVRWAILIKARQWGFPLAAHLFQQAPSSVEPALVRQVQAGGQETTLNNETIRTLIYKSLHEFQPWFHGKISREEAERRIEDCSPGWQPRDGRFLVRERDNYSYAMCISHRNTTKHYRIDVLPTGELAIQDGQKFTSLMALVSHYTITNDGLWCALTEACPRPITQVHPHQQQQLPNQMTEYQINGRPLCNSTAQISARPSQMMCLGQHNNLYCTAPGSGAMFNRLPQPVTNTQNGASELASHANKENNNFICTQQGSMASLKAPIKEWLQAINHRWSQLVASQRNQHHSSSSLNSFLFGHQNPLNNHCAARHRRPGHRRAHLSTTSGNQPRTGQQASTSKRKCRNGHLSCGCLSLQQTATIRQQQASLGMQQASSANGVMATCPQTGKKIASELAACETMAGRLQLGEAGGVSNTHTCVNSIGACPSYLASAPTHTGAELVSVLPQVSSGFALNGQSFVGSPLFAVQAANQFQHRQQVSRQQRASCGSSSGGSGNSAAGGDNGSELASGDSARLISPMQSICGQQQQQQQQQQVQQGQTVDQIYDSSRGFSSALLSSDNWARQAAKSSLTSSSLASSQQFVLSQYGGSTASTLPACSAAQYQPDRRQPILTQQQQQKQQLQSQTQVPQTRGPILCGQHAGPAFRYTNCQDQSHMRPCAHHRTNTKALDDLQLNTGSSPLAAPAALTRFVQFQDGQCLRTHRDTQSIQQAYLCAARQHPQAMGAHRTIPTKMMNGPVQRRPEPIYGNPAGKQDSQRLNQTTLKAAEEEDRKQEEVDLMYCGEDNEDQYLLQHHFKYDPKQIKSSSIETLCGIGLDREEPLESNLDNFKTNSELIMSLQSYWTQGAKQQDCLPSTQLNYGVSVDSIQQQEQTEQEPGTGISGTFEGSCELLESQLRKKHDLDELTTTVLAELDASLKAQVELKNKRAGFCLLPSAKASENNQPSLHQPQAFSHTNTQPPPPPPPPPPAQVNPLELINEFDTLISNNR